LLSKGSFQKTVTGKQVHLKRCENVKKIFLILIILAVLLALLPALVSAATYYVSTTGSDSNLGTSLSQPWRTIGKANSLVQPGDIVYVRAGTYAEVIEPYVTGTSSGKITYKNYNGEQVILRGESGKLTVVSIGWAFHGNWNGRSYIVVDGFTIQKSDMSATSDGGPIGVFISGEGSNHNEVRNLIIDGLGANMLNGIVISKGSYNIIENNRMFNGCKAGIMVGGGGLDRNNILRNNVISDPYFNAMNIGSGLGNMHNLLIEGNTICGSVASDGIQFENRYDLPTGVRDNDSNRGVVIRNNIICNNAENGIDMKGGAYIVAEGNMIYGNTGNNDGGIPLHNNDSDNRYGGKGGLMHGANAGSKNVIIRNNVIYDCLGGILAESYYDIYNNNLLGNNRDYTGSDSTYDTSRKPLFDGIGLFEGDCNNYNSCRDIAIKNNIMAGNKDAEMSIKPSTQYSNIEINNNLYYNSAHSAQLGNFTAHFSWNKISLAMWKQMLSGKSGVIGADANSFEQNPRFVDSTDKPIGSHTQYDFHLSSSSPAIDKGGFLTQTTSAGSGTTIPIGDAGYFFDGYFVTQGDVIQLQGQTITARILSIDYNTNTITINRSLSWTSGLGVALAYSGSAPDIGAFEYVGSSSPQPVPGDLTGDGIVDVDDLIIVARNFGKTAYEQMADTNGDGVVDIFDVVYVASRFS
jgi:hypothetical protein